MSQDLDKDRHLQTMAVHAGYSSSSSSTDIVQPLHLTTTYERNSDGSIGDMLYSRLNNPNRVAVETKMAAMEGGEEAIAFSSGMAAIHALFETVLKPGSHVIIPDDCYHGTRALVHKFFGRWNIEFSDVDMADINNVAAAIKKNTAFIWIETPSNPQLKITDIKAVVELAKPHNILTGCDNTFATPFLQRPLDIGVDFSMHSSTKFFSGHSDILSGVVIVKNKSEQSDLLREFQKTAGAVPSPFDCWLLNRSLATFPLRLPVQCSNTLALANYLSNHNKIEKVFYPGLPSDPYHAIANRQMKNGYGAILSILVKGGQEAAMQFAGKLKIFKHATSLGGVESLLEHRRTAEGEHPVSPENLLRLSIGIEYIDDLLKDVKQALA